jgi:hypothetical protein
VNDFTRDRSWSVSRLRFISYPSDNAKEQQDGNKKSEGETTMERYTVTKFDNRTWQVNDTRTKRVYAECGDPEAGGDAEQRARRIARLLNGKGKRVKGQR